jgi:hypothetical protein
MAWRGDEDWWNAGICGQPEKRPNELWGISIPANPGPGPAPN